MDHIETAILNCYGIREAEQNMVFAARLTQHGHTIRNMEDLMTLYQENSRKYCQSSTSNCSEIYGHHHSHRWCKQTISDTDYPASE